MKKDTSQIDISAIKALNPLCYLTDDELAIFINQTKIQVANKGTALIHRGSVHDQALFLLKGKIKLVAEDGRYHMLEGETANAARPVSHLIPHRYTVSALSTVKYIWVDEQVLQNLIARESQCGEYVEDINVDHDILDSPLFREIYQDLQVDKLAIPALPDIVLRIQRLINEDADVHQLKAVVQTEPALSALILKVANSALYHSNAEINTIEEAIQRIGMNTLQVFVVNFALRNLFKSKSPYLKKQMSNLWVHSTEVAAISYVLAKKLKSFNSEHAMLLGLLHDIGILPILNYAQRFPDIADNNDALQETIRKLHGDIGGIIMKKWNFSDDFVNVATCADNWHRDSSPEPDYCDIVLVAQLFSFMGKAMGKDTPPIDKRTLPNLIDVPACQKLGINALSPTGSIALLHDAKEEIAEAMRLLAIR